MKELAARANQTAVNHGFWDPPSDQNPVATKVALIHTEIMEYLDAPPDKRVEEICDVVIRTLDLAAWAEAPFDQFNPNLDNQSWRFSGGSLHRAAAQITQAHRRSDRAYTLDILSLLVLAISTLKSYVGDDWRTPVEAKMTINDARPRLHGRLY